MRKIRRVSWTAQLMAVLLCTGCGTQTAQDIPKLIEPVAINSAYRTVEYGDIGSTKILLGTVVPMDYCHFYATNVTVSEIVVEVGDYVEAGDVLAYADVAFAEEELSELQSELAQENEVYDINCRITETKLAQLEWRKQESTREDNKAEPDVEEPDITDDGMEEGNITAEGMEETDMADDSIEEADITAEDIEEADMADDDIEEQDIENEIQVEQENARYDSLLHQYLSLIHI